jgi:hypothetical protein
VGRRLRTLHAESGVLGVGISDADVSTLLAGWLQVWQCPRPLATRGTGRSGSPRPHAADAEQASRRTAMNKSNRSGRDFGWEIAHAAVSRRPPIFLHTMVPRTEGYTHDAKVRYLSIVQGAFPVAPCPNSPLFLASALAWSDDGSRRSFTRRRL